MRFNSKTYRSGVVVVPLQKDATAGCFGKVNQEKTVADDLTQVSRDGQRDIHMPASYSKICDLDEHFFAAVSGGKT